jgi:hypothetical protein
MLRESGFRAAPGGTLSVTSSEALSMVSMVRFGSSTHSANYDQRRLELCGPSTAACGNQTSFTIPGVGVAIAGPWMVWCVSTTGVVSTAATLSVT